MAERREQQDGTRRSQRSRGAGASSRVTLGDVARAAGVSLATASKVMNGRAAVGAATRARVAEVAQELGYEQRRRRTSDRRSIGVHLESMDSAYVMGVLAGAVHAGRRADVDLVVSSLEHGGLTREWMAEIAARGAEGVIAVVSPIGRRHARWSRNLSLPLIAIDPVVEDPELSGVVTVTATNWEGGEEAVRHLLDLGHERIGILAGPPDSVPARQRLEGYLSALGRAGIEPDPALHHARNFSSAAGEEGAGGMLDLQDPPTAIFAASDALALGALRAAAARGLAVPADLSVVGFDDTMMTGWTEPPLTAVRQPLFSMGQVAVERLLALAADPGAFSHPFKLETRLVRRGSTAPPR